MSKGKSEDLRNVLEIPDPNKLESVDDDNEVIEVSELVAATDKTKTPKTPISSSTKTAEVTPSLGDISPMRGGDALFEEAARERLEISERRSC